jgi:hypothetical protein
MRVSVIEGVPLFGAGLEVFAAATAFAGDFDGAEASGRVGLDLAAALEGLGMVQVYELKISPSA